MGAARIRKLKGTYPTREQIAAMEMQRLKEDVNRPYILTAADLKLPEVPDHARESVRAFLAPFLPSIPVKNGDCWNLARKLMKAANSPRVNYVEGVWTSKRHQDDHRLHQCDCDDYEKASFGAPHAWNTVDDYLVDLSVENKFRAWKPEYAEFDPLDGWWHEPLREYSLEDIKKYTTEQYELDGFSITAPICMEGYGEDYGILFTYDDYKRAADAGRAGTSYEEYIFKPASDRLQACYEQTMEEVAA